MKSTNAGAALLRQPPQPTQVLQLPSPSSWLTKRAPFADGGAVENALRTAAQRRLNHKPLPRVPDRLIGAGKAPADKLIGQHSPEVQRLAAQRERTRRAEGGPLGEGDAPLDLGGLGDAIGKMIGGGDRNVVAKDQPAENAAPASNGLSDFFDRWSSNPLSQFLFQAGVGAMASDRVNPMQALGEGASRALPNMQQLIANQRDLQERERQRRADLDFSKRVLAPDANETPATEAPDTTTPDKGSTAVPAVPVIAPAEPRPLDRDSSQPLRETPQPITKASEQATTPTSATGAIDRQLAGLLSEHRRLSALGAMADSEAQRRAVAARQADIKTQLSALQQERQRIDTAAYRNRDQIGIVGRDAFGNPIYGYTAGAQIGQPLPARESPTQPGGTPDAELHGEEMLGRLPAQTQDYIRGIARGELKPPAGQKAQQVLALVKQYDPRFDADLYRQRSDMRRGYSPQGKIGQQLNSASAALQHAEQLLLAHNRMGNSNWRIVNTIVNPITGLRENPALRDFELNKLGLAGEVERYLKGGSAAEGSLRALEAQISPNSTPAEIRAVLNKIAEIMGGKTKVYLNDWKKVFDGTDAEIPLNSLPHDLEENERIEKLLRDEFAKTQKSVKQKADSSGDVPKGVTVAPQQPVMPQAGDEIERHGTKYRWDANERKYLRVKE
jgi:hypothetical protein